MELATATAEDFEKLLFEKFRLRRPEAEIDEQMLDTGEDVNPHPPEFELISVDRHGPIRNLDGEIKKRSKEPFSLLFRGNAGTTHPGGIYSLINENMGALEMFLSPVIAGGIAQTAELPQATHYEAVFG